MKKLLKNSFALLLSAALVLSVVPAGSAYAKEVDVENTEMKPQEAEIQSEGITLEEQTEDTKEEAQGTDEKSEKVGTTKSADDENGDGDTAGTVTIASVPVVFAGGEPVEDGHVFCFETKDGDSDTYTSKDGKLWDLKLRPGIQYQVSIDWDDDLWYDYELAYGYNGYLRVAVNEDSETLMSYDAESEAVTSKVVDKIVIKEYGADDPADRVQVPRGEIVNVADIAVEYEDGTPVEDGVVFDLFNMKSIDSLLSPEKFTVKDGKLSGIKMEAEQQYKIGFDVSNEYWKELEVVGAYESTKLMRIYARYEGEVPLYYDYDEGVDGEEIQISKLVIKKVEGEAVQTPSNSCIMELLLSDNGYQAEGGLPFRLIRQDNGKEKRVYSKEGEVTLNAAAYVEYLLKLDENETYEIDFDTNPVFTKYKELGGIPFTCMMDSRGKWHAILKGYDVEEDEGKLNCTYLDLKRIDGKENSGDKPFDQGGCDTPGVEMIYTGDVVTLSGMPIMEAVEGQEDSATSLTKEITFEFYDCTTQSVEAEVISKDGVLPDVEMVKGHHYIVSAKDTEYEMPNYYITLSASGNKASCYKCGGTEDRFVLYKRTTPLDDVSMANKVDVTLPVYYTNADGDVESVSGVKVRLVSPIETVEAVSEDGEIHAALIEDNNYMVLVDDEKYAIESFPLTVKDKSEYGMGKYTFNHFSCGSVSGLYLVDKGTEHDRDVEMLGSSEKTTVTGLNFGKGSYYINDRVLDDYKVSELDGKDYEVIDIDAINMYRTEISKLAAGDFKITREVPEGKKVANVYYIDKDNKLQELSFTESNGKVTFTMGSLSMYHNVIEYTKAAVTPAKAETIAAKQVTLAKSKYTYTGKSIKPAVKVVNKAGKTLKAGTDYTVAYSGNKKVGTAKVVVTLKNHYSGKITKTFTINPKSVSVKSLKKSKKAFTVKWGKRTSQTTGYQIRYSTKKNFKSNVKKVTVGKNKTTTKKIKKLKSRKKYYVQVRTYKKVGGKKYYSSWSKVKSVKTK